ncbi:hypothetical protein OHA21_13820 [Actinoplanes sp. NBC_00393]|uniref:hypothetical protein n=1 Tax=Actinoplanes sp. NBC_00393 TaxID=2975953 RepID=UPI002E1BA6A9
MTLLQLVTDRYNRTARFLPAVLVVVPLIVLAVTAIPVAVGIAGKVAAAATFCLPVLVSQAVRDRGLRAEPGLFETWGGRPSELLLRWRDAPAPAVVARRHRLVATHLGVELPNAAAEQADPVEADALYAVATAALRERTRERARFPLVYEEVISYGLRRNGFACRAPGIAVCGLAIVCTLVLAYWAIVPLGWKQQAALVGFDLVWAAVWLRWFTMGSVRRAAEKYAEQLFVSLETLGTAATVSTPEEP